MHKGLFALLLGISFCVVTWCFAGEVEQEVEEIGDDIKASFSLFKADSRFVPVPIPILDPTIGYGLALAGVYFHPPREGDAVSPATISGVAGAYTNSESWLLGGFHDGSYAEDRYRVEGFLGYGEFNLKFYGIGDDPALRVLSVDYTAKAGILAPKLLFRLPWENWFLGPEYSILNIDLTFKPSSFFPGLPDIDATTRTAGLGLVGVYESTDHDLWPSDGTRFECTVTDYGTYFGGDFDYTKFALEFVQYFPLRDTITFSYRLDGQFIEGDAPFYDLSNLNIRGFPIGRFVDNHTMSGQAEVRWNFYKKWTALVFGGVGWIAEKIDEFNDSKTRLAGGVGIRYMIQQEQKLAVGIDVAYGEDEVVVYFQVGDFFGS